MSLFRMIRQLETNHFYMFRDKYNCIAFVRTNVYNKNIKQYCFIKGGTKGTADLSVPDIDVKHGYRQHNSDHQAQEKEICRKAVAHEPEK